MKLSPIVTLVVLGTILRPSDSRVSLTQNVEYECARYVSGGGGLGNNMQTTTVTLADLGDDPTLVLQAFLYYHGIVPPSEPEDFAATSYVDGAEVVAQNIGRGHHNRPSLGSGYFGDAFRADITDLVKAKGDGEYQWMHSLPPPVYPSLDGFRGNGVSIIVILRGGDQTVRIYDGNDSSWQGYNNPHWFVSIDNVFCEDPCDPAHVQFHVADGFTDPNDPSGDNEGGIYIRNIDTGAAYLLAPGGDKFKGSACDLPKPECAVNLLWDIETYYIPPHWIETFVPPNTLEVRSYHYSDTVALIALVVDYPTPDYGDSDLDGVSGCDRCPNTVIPESVPTRRLGRNRFVMGGASDPLFSTRRTKGGVTPRSYTMEQTGGCTCEQIIAMCGYGRGHTKYGCSRSVMDWWTGQGYRDGKHPFQCKHS